MKDFSSIPFLIGITGHRDIHVEDRERLEEAVSVVIRRYQVALPNTDIALLSGLASGADQVAAMSAFAIPGARVIAVLPMPVSEYREDFTELEREKFDLLLSQCDGVITASQYMEKVASPESDYRDGLYQNAGRFIARNSSVLIAAWDGIPPEFVGGTADIVYYKSAGLVPLRSGYVEFNQGPVDPGLILHYPVRRQVSDQIPDGHLNLLELDGLGAAKPWRIGIDSSARALDALNSSMHSMSSSEVGTCTDRLLNASDHGAMVIQSRYRKMLITLLASGILSLTLIALMQTIDSPGPALIAALSIIALGCLWWYFRRSDLKTRFQSMRALAEGARVQSVWQASDLHDGVAEEYLAGQTGSAAWIRQTLRGAYVADEASARNTTEAHIAEVWMREQVDYFRGGANRAGAIERAFHRGATIKNQALVAGSIALATLFADMVIVIASFDLPLWTWVALRMVWTSGFALTIALVSYGEIMGFKQLSARYAVALPIFDHGLAELRRLAQSENVSESDEQKIIWIVGRQALREAGDWFALQSAHEVRPV